MQPRDSIRASALGSYFGVGYAKPLEQLAYDMGTEEVYFMPVQEDAMEIASLLEDGIINIVEKKNNCIVTERNTETLTAMDGKLRVRKDGFTTINGENYVVEVKHLASGQNLINNKGYHFQVMAQIIAEREQGKDVDKGILAGLYEGRYYQIFLELTPEVEEDIRIMINTVVAILQGELPVELFPANITDKYSPLPTESEEFNDEDEQLVIDLVDIKAKMKELKTQEKTIVDYLKNTYKSLEHSLITGEKITISERTRKGNVDYEALVTEHPEIDVDSYRKENTVYSAVSVK